MRIAPGGVRPAALLVALTLLAGHGTTVRAGTPAHLWSHRFGDSLNQDFIAVAVDADGNTVVGGYFAGTVNFGGADLTSVGGDDVFVARFDASGAHQWSKRFGGSADDFLRGVAVDASGNVIITGSFYGTANFGGSNLSAALCNNVYVAKYSPTGAHLWSQGFGDNDCQSANSVAVDAAGDVIITGSFEGTVNFGGLNLTSAGGYDIFLAKFTANGAHVWSRRFGDSVSYQSGVAVATDGSGNVIVVGNFAGTVSFSGSTALVAAGFDVFLAKFDASGGHLWSQHYGDISYQYASTVSTDATGNVVIAGYYAGTVNFGGSDLTTVGLENVFLAKFNAAGGHQWSQRFGQVNQPRARARFDPDGNVILAGGFAGTINLGGQDLVAVGDFDVYLAKFTPDGGHLWSQRFGDAGHQRAYSVAAHPNRNIAVAGVFTGAINFGGANLASAGGYDVFLATFGGETSEPSIGSIADVGNDQGKRVLLEVSPSGLDDVGAGTPIDYYEVYRSDEGPPQAWTLAGRIPAHASEGYTAIAPTLEDSTVSGGQHFSTFLVRAVSTPPVIYYDSAPDSGYSLDNLAPGVPTGLLYATGVLTWDGAGAADVDHYVVYGSRRDDFGAATLIDYTRVATLDVTASPYAYYFVTAADRAGNESAPAAVAGPADAADTPGRFVLSVSAYPNPFNPATTIRYTLPSPGRVTITIHNARGALVATLVDAPRETGAHTAPWNGTGRRGERVSAGVYFVRIAFAGALRSYKLVLVK